MKFCTVRVVSDVAADDFEEGDAAGEGVGHGFVDVEGEGLFVVDAAHDDFVLIGGSMLSAWPLADVERRMARAATGSRSVGAGA